MLGCYVQFRSEHDEDRWLITFVDSCGNVFEPLKATKSIVDGSWSTPHSHLAIVFWPEPNATFTLTVDQNNKPSSLCSSRRTIAGSFTHFGYVMPLAYKTPNLPTNKDSFLVLPGNIDAVQLRFVLNHVTLPEHLNLLDASNLAFERNSDMLYAILAIGDCLLRCGVSKVQHVRLPLENTCQMASLMIELLLSDALKTSVDQLDIALLNVDAVRNQGKKMLDSTLEKFTSFSRKTFLYENAADFQTKKLSLSNSSNNELKLQVGSYAAVKFATFGNSNSTKDEQKFPLAAWNSAGDLRNLGKGTGIRVAILDTGFNIAHKSLSNVKCIWSFIDGAHAFFDGGKLGHGTFCASIVAEIARDAELYLARVLDDDGVGSVKSLVDAIHWAIDSGCHVISMSLGTSSPDLDLLDAIARAQQLDIHIVCAAANAGGTGRSNIAYPARFGHVLCVGGADPHGHAAASSSTGRELDFLAPSENILGAFHRSTMKAIAKSGTSVAVPCVAGLIAVLLAHFENSAKITRPLNCAEMKSLLVEMCTHPGAHNHSEGYGMICLSRRYVLPEALDVIAADIIEESKLDEIGALVRTFKHATGTHLANMADNHHLTRHHIIPEPTLKLMRKALVEISKWLPSVAGDAAILRTLVNTCLVQLQRMAALFGKRPNSDHYLESAPWNFFAGPARQHRCDDPADTGKALEERPLSFCDVCYPLIKDIYNELPFNAPASPSATTAADVAKLTTILAKLQAIDACVLSPNGKHEVDPLAVSSSVKKFDLHGFAHLRSRTKKNATAPTVSSNCPAGCEVSNFYESDKGGGDWIVCKPPCPNNKAGPHFRLRKAGE